jgi:hypothetical protein
MMMTTLQIFQKFGEVKKNYKRQGLRYGQAVYNCLATFAPDIAEKIQGTEFDPFFDDNKVGAFMNEVFRIS